ncbi:MAG: ATP-grasp domain-containing protein [Sedimentisphaeraceae bacterium JB056]
MANEINILFTCVGRRVSLINSFRNAAASLGKDCKICGTDVTELAAGMQVCESYYIVSSTQSSDYINQLLDIVKREEIDLLIPTTDHDLLALAVNRGLFEELGCFVLIAEPQVVELCQDKRLTYKFLSENGFNTPKTSLPSELDPEKIAYPCFLKPWDGYASRGATIANDAAEFEFYSKRIPNCISQQYIKGDEITCDVFTDRDGQVRSVVPRKRLEVRAGEVNKAVIVKDRDVMDQVAKLAGVLDTKFCILTIQLLLSEDRQVYFIEINPRFGGGMPLSIKAGANFPLWLLEKHLGLKCSAGNNYQDGLTMLRYDAEVWL